MQNPNDTIIEDWGRLEVYLDGEWGTICANGFNVYAADTACQQLGYEDSFGEISKAIDYADIIPLASNSTPIHTGHSECVGATNDGGFSHFLRCFYLYADPTVTCTHDDDVIIQCSMFLLVNSGYDTELFLDSKAFNSTYKSSGVLQIYSSSESGAFWGWSNICSSRFDQNAANTACIQLGYTGALSYTTHANRSRELAFNDIWLDGVTCGDNVYSCLDSCFCYPRTLTAVQCDPGNVVALTCTFDLAKRDADHPGGRDWCEETKKTYCAPEMPSTETPTKLIIISTVLSTVIVLLSLVIVGLMVVIWNHRGRAQYQTLN